MDSVDHGSRGVELERDLEAECLDVPRRFMDDEQLDVRGGLLLRRFLGLLGLVVDDCAREPRCDAFFLCRFFDL